MSAFGRCLPHCVVCPYMQLPKEVVCSLVTRKKRERIEESIYIYKWVDDQNIPKPCSRGWSQKPHNNAPRRIL